MISNSFKLKKQTNKISTWILNIAANLFFPLERVSKQYWKCGRTFALKVSGVKIGPVHTLPLLSQHCENGVPTDGRSDFRPPTKPSPWQLPPGTPQQTLPTRGSPAVKLWSSHRSFHFQSYLMSNAFLVSVSPDPPKDPTDQILLFPFSDKKSRNCGETDAKLPLPYVVKSEKTQFFESWLKALCPLAQQF